LTWLEFSKRNVRKNISRYREFCENWSKGSDTLLTEVNKFQLLHKILRKNPDFEYYNKDMKRLKVKVRKVYNERKLRQPYQTELKRLSKELLAANGSIITDY
jgi:hypothetical protein